MCVMPRCLYAAKNAASIGTRICHPLLAWPPHTSDEAVCRQLHRIANEASLTQRMAWWLAEDLTQVLQTPSLQHIRHCLAACFLQYDFIRYSRNESWLDS